LRFSTVAFGQHATHRCRLHNQLLLSLFGRSARLIQSARAKPATLWRAPGPSGLRSSGSACLGLITVWSYRIIPHRQIVCSAIGLGAPLPCPAKPPLVVRPFDRTPAYRGSTPSRLPSPSAAGTFHRIDGPAGPTIPCGRAPSSGERRERQNGFPQGALSAADLLQQRGLNSAAGHPFRIKDVLVFQRGLESRLCAEASHQFDMMRFRMACSRSKSATTVGHGSFQADRRVLLKFGDQLLWVAS